MPDLARAFLRLVSWLVPAGRRREFLDEWHAEIRGDAGQHHGVGQRMRRVSGAPADALALRFERWRAGAVRQDVRYAFRLARRTPGFTALVVATLGLGIGGNTAIFSVVSAVLLRPLPYRAPDRLVVLWEDDGANGHPRSYVSPGSFTDWAAENRTFGALMSYFAGSAILTTGDQTERIPIGSVSANFNDVLGVAPLVGRGFAPRDAGPGEPGVALVSYAAWRARFGGDPALVGRDIVLSDVPYRVIGIMPRGFFLFDREIEIWRPHVISARAATIRNVGYLAAVGRLRDDATYEQARADMQTIAAEAARRHPAANEHHAATLVPMREQLVGDVRRPLFLLAAALGMVLLIGCANLANLLLASAVGRRREFAVRAAVGADRGRLTQQLLTEGVILAGVGGGAGLVLAWWWVGGLRTLASTILPAAGDATLDWRVLAFTLAVSLLTGLIFATLPALYSSRVSAPRELAGTARSSADPAARRAAAGLVIAELVLAVILTSGASLALRSLWNVASVDPGFAVDDVLTAQVTLPVSRYFGVQPINEFYAAVETRLRAVHGVRAAGVTSVLPLTGTGLTSEVSLVGGAPSAEGPLQVAVRATTADYVAAMGLRLIDGRFFGPDDRTGTAPVAVINRALAERLFPGRPAIGASLQLGTGRGAAPRTVVGVVGDVRQEGPERPPLPEVYVPMTQGSPYTTAAIVVRVEGDPDSYIAALRAAVHSVDPAIPLARVQSMRDRADDSVAGRRASTMLLSMLAALALVLALVGIYGILAHGVSQRAPEIGIRLALGARRGELLLMVMRRGLALTMSGLVLGQGLAIAGGRLVRSLLFGVEPGDPLTCAVVSVAVIAATAAACYVPARRAAAVDPASMLRR